MFGIGEPLAGGGLDNDPVSSKELEKTHDELNERAVAVVQRIQTKLTGRDFGDIVGALSVNEQVWVLLLLLLLLNHI